MWQNLYLIEKYEKTTFLDKYLILYVYLFIINIPKQFKEEHLMGRIMVISNDKQMRSEIQEEVNSFSDKVEISFITSHISKKYGCDAEVQYPRAKGEKRFVYCYFPA